MPRLFSWYLTKYLSREVLFSFFMGTAIFLLIMLMFQIIRLSEFAVVHQVALADVARICVYLMLTFLPIAIPIAFLFAVLMGISRANSEGEILALQVNGIGLGQIFAPLCVFSFFVSFFCLYTALYTVPKGNRSFELLITKLANERVMAALKPGVFQEGFYGLVLFAEQIVPLPNEMKRVFIYDDREDAHPLAITAAAGILRHVGEHGVLTLRLTDGSIHVDKKFWEPVQQKIDFDVYDINLEMGEKGDSWRDYSPPSYDYDQLRKRIAETIHDPPEHRKLLVELHRRFSLSFSCVVFAALGFFIGILSQRGVRSTAIILCMGVGMVYWLSYIMANALAAAGWVAPWLGIWSPNLLFAGVARYCYTRYGR
jgi:lipopolysaccharide export system permease protein